MAEVQFYHLLTTPLERALPKLMEKSLAAKMRAVVLVGSESIAERLDEALWSTDAASFIPHGTLQDAQPDQQPIYITTRQENPNDANVLVVTDGSFQEAAGGYTKLLDLFDGHDPQAVEAARERWKRYKEADITVSYIQQQKDGGWKKMS